MIPNRGALLLLAEAKSAAAVCCEENRPGEMAMFAPARPLVSLLEPIRRSPWTSCQLIPSAVPSARLKSSANELITPATTYWADADAVKAPSWLFVAVAPTGYAPAPAAAGEVTRSVVAPPAPGDSVRAASPRRGAQPAGTAACKAKLVAEQALLSLLVSDSV